MTMVHAGSALQAAAFLNPQLIVMVAMRYRERREACLSDMEWPARMPAHARIANA
jgi:hypothetical protein